jgi:hypothetical protein
MFFVSWHKKASEAAMTSHAGTPPGDSAKVFLDLDTTSAYHKNQSLVEHVVAYIEFVSNFATLIFKLNMDSPIPVMYLDTSVVNGYYAQRFANDTRPLFERMQRGEVIFMLSDHLRQELAPAPAYVRTLLDQFDNIHFVNVYTTPQALDLAQLYIQHKVIGHSHRSDCLHIAIATVHHADALASWNFKHIANDGRITGYNAVNLMAGYQAVNIKTPKDLLHYGN